MFRKSGGGGEIDRERRIDIGKTKRIRERQIGRERVKFFLGGEGS